MISATEGWQGVDGCIGMSVKNTGHALLTTLLTDSNEEYEI